MLPDSLRQRVLADWRGYGEVGERPDKTASIAGVLAKILPKLGLNERLTEQQMMEAWRDIVGDFLALHSIPTALSGGVLTIRVVQPSVRYELDRSWKREILKKLQARFGPGIVREIRFRI